MGNRGEGEWRGKAGGMMDRQWKGSVVGKEGVKGDEG